MLVLILLAFFAFVFIVLFAYAGNLWSSILNFICALFAAILATNLFEPMASKLDDFMSELTYLYDFIVIWGLFFIVFIVLRLGTTLLSKYRVRFDIVTEMIGRFVAGSLLAGVFISFTTFTIHMAPLSVSPYNGFQKKPDTINLVVGPDMIWHGFIQYMSRRSFSAAREAWFLPEYDAEETTWDADRNCRVFDSQDLYIHRYRHRRDILAGMEKYTTPLDKKKKK